MRQFWLPIATVALLLAGCSTRSESPPVVCAPKAEGPFGKQRMEPAGRLFDDFHLPLVIEITPPEVPPEIQGPSPPIKEEPKLP